jgi:hypothetical protein
MLVPTRGRGRLAVKAFIQEGAEQAQKADPSRDALYLDSPVLVVHGGAHAPRCAFRRSGQQPHDFHLRRRVPAFLRLQPRRAAPLLGVHAVYSAAARSSPAAYSIQQR